MRKSVTLLLVSWETTRSGAPIGLLIAGMKSTPSTLRSPTAAQAGDSGSPSSVRAWSG
jgi:hypothetical protein